MWYIVTMEDKSGYRKLNRKSVFQTSFISVFKSVDLASRKIPVILQKARKPGPVVWVAAAIHGDEVTGTETVFRLNRFLKRNPLIKGAVYSLPVMNPLGYELVTRYMPIEYQDLNRCFPGFRNGNTGERIAFKIFSEIVNTNPDLVIDLHTDTMESIPYIYLDQILDHRDAHLVRKILKYAEISGINYFVENAKTYEEELKNTITGALINIAKIPAFTVELGGPLVVKPKFVEIGLSVIKNILSYLGMIQPLRPLWVYHYKVPINGIYETVWYEYSPDYSGIVEYKVQPGDIVKRGEPLARIKNLFDKTLQIIKAREDSIVISYADQSVCFPGTELFTAAKRNDKAFGFVK